jgi:predicted ArsR family transcriptional regulator
MHDMDVFDRRILSILRDGQAKYFEQILYDVALSPNTLRQHLDKLMNKGMVERSKRPMKGPGRPRFVYHLFGDSGGLALSALLDPYKGLVVISFDKLRRLCRHEKCGYCKELRGRCTPQYCPQIEK